MSVKIQLKRTTASAWTSLNPTLDVGEIGFETDTKKFKIGDGTTVWTSLPYSITANLASGTLNDLGDVTITSAANGDFLRWNGSAWINDAVNLSTDTVGDYVQNLVAGTGVTVTNNSGEATTPTIAIGQAVGTSSSVTFAHVSAPVTGNVTGDVSGNAGTATALQNARTISLGGDLSGSASFNGTSNVTITASVQPNSVALGTDTTGSYVESLVAGTGVTLSNNSGESATPTIAIGQDVATNSNVTFNNLTVSGDLIVSGTTTSINTETLTVDDNIIILNNNATGAPSQDAGIEVERGSSTNVSLRWNETSDKWETTNDGTNYGNIVTTADSGTVTSTMIADGTIVNADIDASAAIALSKLASGTSAQVVIANSSGVPTYTTLSGDVTISNTGVASIAANSVALGTDTTGNYVADVIAGTAITVTHTPGEGSSATIAVTANTFDAFGAASTAAGNAATALSNHEADTTNIHGIADTSILVTTTGTQTLTNKTITSPAGLVKGDVGLGNVDNTSDANKPVSTAQQTALDLKANLASPTFTGTVTVPAPVGDTNAATKLYVDTTASTTAGNASTALSNHEADTTNIHGIADTSILVTTTGSQTLTNKTITSPAGLVKGDVGLGNVDNTSDANKPVSTATQTALDLKANLNSPTFTGTVTLPDNTVALGTKTTGDYVATITGGTGVSSTAATSGEGTTHTLSIGQAVGTTDNVAFAGVTADNIKVGVTGANEIDTVSGDLTIDSAGGTVTIDDNLTVTGNLTVSGSTTSVNTETLTVDDNIIVLNNNVTSTPSENAGIEVERGTSSNVSVRWNETSDKWEVTNDGTNYGDIVSTYDTGTVTSAMIANGAIVDADINASAAIAISKLAPGTSAQVIVANSSGVPTYTTLSGDVTISSTGIVSIAENSVTLGTDTTGNYVASLVAGTGVAISNNSGEGATPTVTIGQDVATSASVTFAVVNAQVNGNVTGNLTGNASTATTLQTARNIAGQAFDGSANISIAPTDLTGVTSTAAEINILDGATLSTAELNFVDGVTSAIQTQIDAKAPLASPTFTGTVSGITKTMVGLGNVDNTSDADKPVSTATQTALNLKANLDSPTFTGTPTLPTGTVAVTQTLGNNTTAVATTAFIQTALANFGGMTVSDTAPASGDSGDFWWDSTGLNLYIYYSNNWVQVSSEDPVFFELSELLGVEIGNDLLPNHTLRFDGPSGNWVNSAPRQNVGTITTTSYSVSASDSGKVLLFNNASAISVDLGSWSASVGEKVDIVRYGTGQVTVTVSGSVTKISPNSSVTTRAQYSLITATCVAANTFLLSGDLT